MTPSTTFVVELSADWSRVNTETQIRQVLTIHGYDFSLNVNAKDLAEFELEITIEDEVSLSELSHLKQKVAELRNVETVEQQLE